MTKYTYTPEAEATYMTITKEDHPAYNFAMRMLKDGTATTPLIDTNGTNPQSRAQWENTNSN